MAFCLLCRQEVGVQSIAVQTDCTELPEPEILLFQSPGEKFGNKYVGQLVKNSQSQGDCAIDSELFNESELSSIVEQESFSEISILQSFIGNADCEDSSSIGGNYEFQLEHWRKKLLSPRGSQVRKFKFLNTTPRLKKYKSDSFEKDCYENYEEIMTSIGCSKDEDLKESFIQLVQVEKISLRLQLHKNRFSCGKL